MISETQWTQFLELVNCYGKISEKKLIKKMLKNTAIAECYTLEE